MKEFYEKENLSIIEFDLEDVITTFSGNSGNSEHENAYGGFNEFDNPPEGGWF